MRVLDPKTSSQRDIYRTMIGAIVPRPIAWVGTTGEKGHNLAPFSFFNGVSSAPPVLCFSVAFGEEGVKKDTQKNIETRREFTVNIASVELAEKLNQSSAPYPEDINEFEQVGLTPLASEKISAPRVGECRVQMECRLFDQIQVGPSQIGASILILGEILLIHIAEEVLETGRIQAKKLDPLSRLGGKSYGKAPETFELPFADASL